MGGTYILNKTTLAPIAVIEDYHQIEFEREFFTFGKFTMSMNFQQFNARSIQKGQLIGIALDSSKSFDRVFMVEQIQFNQGRNAVDEIIEVSGRDIGGMSQERLAVPQSGQFENFNGASESLMKFFVTRHMVAALNPNRNIPNLFVKTDQGRGVVIDFQARYQVISELLEEIGRNAQMGWDFFFEADTGTFQFDILLGTDKSDTVFFDFDFESILEQKLLRSDWGKKNVAFIGGNGDASTGRSVATTFLGAFAPTGFDRKEAWVDASDTDDTAIPTILTTKGTSFLRDTDIDEAVELEINPFGPYSYRTDFDLGDVVTVRNTRWSFLKAMQIVAIKVTITTEFPRPVVTVTLDKPLPKFETALRKNFRVYKPTSRR